MTTTRRDFFRRVLAIAAAPAVVVALPKPKEKPFQIGGEVGGRVFYQPETHSVIWFSHVGDPSEGWNELSNCKRLKGPWTEHYLP